MVNLHCDYAWILNHHGNIPLHFAMRAFPDRFNRERKSALNVKDAISWTGPPMKTGKSQLSTPIQDSVS